MARFEQVKEWVIGVFFGLMSCMAFADVIVVVSSKSDVGTLSYRQVERIFLGKAERFPSGLKAAPLDLPEDSKVRDEFYKKLTGKSQAQMKAYWSKVIFTGRGIPPRVVGESINVKKIIAQNPSYVGYIPQGMKDSSVKTVLVVE